MAKNITTIKSPKSDLSWTNITNAQQKEINYLKRKFKFNELDLNDSYAKKYSQRPKLNIRNDYCFLIIQFPVYRKKNRAIKAEEINFFISKENVITIHRNNLPPLVEFFNFCNSDSFYRQQYLSETNASLIYEIIIRLQEYSYPLLDRLSLDILNIEQNIFAGHERKMVNEILSVKRNILEFRKIMKAHKNVIKKLSQEKIKFFPAGKLKIYYQDLIEHSKNIWEILENHKETIEALENTNTTMVSFKLNNIMRVLTIFSVIVFPLTLLAAIFGMNTINGMPFMDNPYGFWIIITIMLIATLTMFLFFRRKNWI